ncbi:hypothetical protein GCM10020254_82850 [Streptomyces goshikiensis]
MDPLNVRSLVAESFPGGDDDARLAVVWLAAIHDIGKATPAFACQVDGLATRMRDVGLEMPTAKQFGDARKRAPHGLAGQVIVEEWLERQGWSPRAAMAFATPVGGHHGVPPGHEHFHSLHQHPELLRTPGPSEQLWRDVQTELLDACSKAYGAQPRLPDWASVKLPQPVQVVLSALVILADWIASNPRPLPPLPPGPPPHRFRTDRGGMARHRTSAALVAPRRWGRTPSACSTHGSSSPRSVPCRRRQSGWRMRQALPVS